MKHPKNRTTIYVIIRLAYNNPVILDSFRTYERAEEVLGIYQKDKPEYEYEIMASTYYNE
jgi:hypothetical protein